MEANYIIKFECGFNLAKTQKSEECLRIKDDKLHILSTSIQQILSD